MKRALISILIALLATVVFGCAQIQSQQPIQVEAQQRWSRMRAQVKLQLAQRTYEHGSIEEAHGICQEVLGLDPESRDGYLLMARIQMDKGQLAMAEAALDAVSGFAAPTVELFYLRGLLAERKGDFIAAEDWFGRCVMADAEKPVHQVDPEHLAAWVQTLLKLDRIDQAVDVLQNRVGDYEQAPTLHLLYAQALSLQGQLEPAGDACLVALQMAPKSRLLREETAMALLRTGRTGEAQVVLEPMLNRSEDPPTLAVVRALCSGLIEAGETRRAVELLEPVVADNGRDFTLWLLLGKAYLVMGRPEAALHPLEKSAELRPDCPEARLLLVYQAIAADRRDRATALAEQFIEQFPEDPQARRLLDYTLTWQDGAVDDSPERVTIR